MPPSSLAALLGLLACIASGMRLPRQAPGLQLRVAVQELMPVLPNQSSLPSLRSMGLSMDDIYGGPVCSGAPGFVDRADAPPQFCRYAGRDFAARALARPSHPQWVFDNYALERIMLGKWLSSSALCRVGKGPDDCGPSGPNVVVLPSPSLHYFAKGGFAWKTFYTQNVDAHRKYWAAVRALYNESQGERPLFVVHHPFAFHHKASTYILDALAEQPAQFVDRVVIAVLEGNLFRKNSNIFHGASFSDPEATLMRRSGATAPVGRAAPLIISMPYPTSILEAVSFAGEGRTASLAGKGKTRGGKAPKTEAAAYSPERRRPIAVSFQASHKPGAWIREEVFRQMRNRSLVCASGQARGCGLTEPSLWDIATNSAFCIEPPGDTLTRASFYIAVLSGCVPVVFDGGHEKFDESEPTQWAWRSPAAEAGETSQRLEPFLDYREFAVIINASEVKRDRTDVVKMLVDMPKKDPQRFAALRAGLDRVAPVMRYAKKQCDNECDDAFTTFQAVLGQALASKARA